jgi:hypothetical protein
MTFRSRGTLAKRRATFAVLAERSPRNTSIGRETTVLFPHAPWGDGKVRGQKMRQLFLRRCQVGEVGIVRGFTLLLLFLAAGAFGCSGAADDHSESIPDIPPGRSSVGPEAGEQMPVAPPGK